MKELNLTLHCGGYRTELDQVAATKTPAAVGRHVPIPHIEVHHCIERAVSALDMRIVSQIHALACNGQRYFGLYQLVNGKENNEMGLVLGTRNSHDKSFVAGIAAGEGVFACDNLAFSSEVVLGRMHTLNIRRDLPILCNRAVGMLAERWTGMEERVETYKRHGLTDAQVHDFVIRSVDAAAINTTQIPLILREWRTPSHEEFKGGNAWTLFNAYTESFKQIENPAILMRRSQVLHGLMDTECGILAREKPVIDLSAAVAGTALN